MDNRGLYFVFRHCDNIVQDFSILLNYPEKNCFEEEFANIKMTREEEERLMSLILDIIKREEVRVESEKKSTGVNRVLKHFEQDINSSLAGHKSI